MCFCRAQYLLLAVVVLLGLASLLGACGAKGNLYLPKPEQQQTPNPNPPSGQDPAPTEPQSR